MESKLVHAIQSHIETNNQFNEEVQLEFFHHFEEEQNLVIGFKSSSMLPLGWYTMAAMLKQGATIKFFNTLTESEDTLKLKEDHKAIMFDKQVARSQYGNTVHLLSFNLTNSENGLSSVANLITMGVHYDKNAPAEFNIETIIRIIKDYTDFIETMVNTLDINFDKHAYIDLHDFIQAKSMAEININKIGVAAVCEDKIFAPEPIYLLREEGYYALGFHLLTDISVKNIPEELLHIRIQEMMGFISNGVAIHMRPTSQITTEISSFVPQSTKKIGFTFRFYVVGEEYIESGSGSRSELFQLMFLLMDILFSISNDLINISAISFDEDSEGMIRSMQGIRENFHRLCDKAYKAKIETMKNEDPSIQANFVSSEDSEKESDKQDKKKIIYS